MECSGCGKQVNLKRENGWSARNGKDYCEYCYDNVFYPQYYGFTRTAWQKGEAGYGIDQDGKTFKIHEPKHKTKARQEKAAALEHLKSLVEQQTKQKTYGKPKLRLIKGGKDAK